jgi:hypothetical protein
MQSEQAQDLLSAPRAITGPGATIQRIRFTTHAQTIQDAAAQTMEHVVTPTADTDRVVIFATRKLVLASSFSA